MNVCILILAFPLLTYAARTSVKPGRWETSTSVRVNGIPLPSSGGSDCVSKKDARDLQASLGRELGKKNCKLTSWNVKNGELDAALKCEDDHLKAEGQLKGQVAKEKYTLAGDASGSYRSIPSVASFKLEGVWKEDCKP